MEKFYYEKWLKLGEKALRRGIDIADYFQNYLDSIIEVYDLIKQKYFGIIKEIDFFKIHNRMNKETGSDEEIIGTIYGIDSSQAGFHRIGGFLVVPITASKVKLNIKIYKDAGVAEVINNNYAVETDVPNNIHDGLSPEIAARKAHIAMLNMEVYMLDSIYDELNNYDKEEMVKKPVLIYIDGPIIDPPDIKIHVEEFNDYMSSRALAVKKILSLGSNVYIIGFVKRVMGQMFYKRLVEDYSEKIRIERKEFENDWTLSSILLKYHLIKNCSPDEKCVAYTKPLPLDDRNLSFFDEEGLSIYYSYVIFQNFDTIGPYRIDFAIPKIELNSSDLEHKLEHTLEEILYITSKTLIPGHKYPLPISLAHTLCTLPRREAKKIIRIITSKLLKELSISKDKGSLTYEFILTLLSSEGEI